MNLLLRAIKGATAKMTAAQLCDTDSDQPLFFSEACLARWCELFGLTYAFAAGVYTISKS